MHWLKKSAEQGHVLAQYQLALCYVNMKEYVDSAFWFKKAAEQGYAPAQYALGVHYYNNKDNEKSVYWLNKVIANPSNKGVDLDRVNALLKQIRANR